MVARWRVHQTAVTAGLASSGVDVYDAGVIPTPAAAYLVADIDADFGVMISASHNARSETIALSVLARRQENCGRHCEDKDQEIYEKREFIRPTGCRSVVSTVSDAEDRYILHLVGAFRSGWTDSRRPYWTVPTARRPITSPDTRAARCQYPRDRRSAGWPEHQRRRAGSLAGASQEAVLKPRRSSRHCSQRRRRSVPGRGSHEY